MSITRQIDVYLLPALVEPAELAGETVAGVGVLRGPTTIVQALAAGAIELVPCLDVEEAQKIASDSGPSAILGGERGGRQIPGFDLGNSPAEFTPERVAGKTVVFTTTNGTLAMQRCQQARRVLITAFTNMSAVCRELMDEPQVALICAGTDGHVTREDSLLAGALVTELYRGGTAGLPSSAFRKGTARQAGRATLRLNDQAEIAADAWSTA